MASDVKSFLQALHPPELLGSDYFELRAFRKNDGKLVEEWRDFYTDYNLATEKILELYPTFDVYAGVCPRPEKKGRNENIQRSYWVWVDVDSDKVKRKGDSLINLISHRICLPPTMLVGSGSGGLHVYWRIDEVADLAHLQAINNSLAERIHENCDKLGDPARILRIANTLNHKHLPPTPVQLLHYDPTLVYTMGDIEAALRLSKDITLRIYSGSTDGYNSRSERDMFVIGNLVRSGMTDEAIHIIFENKNIGDKADKSKDGHYLGFTLDKVRKQENLQSGEVSPVFDSAQWGFVETSVGYQKINGDGSLTQLSTFVYDPDILLVGENHKEDVVMGTVKSGDFTWSHIPLTRQAFNSVKSLEKQLPRVQWQFFGKDGDVKKLLPFLLDKLMQKGQGQIPTRKAVTTIGRYEDCLVLPDVTLGINGVYEEAEAPIVWLPTGREMPKVSVSKFPDEIVQEEIGKFLNLYFQINTPAVTYAALGWFIAALFKTQLNSTGIRFPVLNLFGTRGSGKTTLLTKVLQPLIGYTESKTYDANTTNFVILSLLGSTNCIPVSFSEYRKSSLRNPESFIRYILLAYDSGSDSRGRADQTTVEYPLTAPFTVDGEDAIADPACLERTIQLNMHPETITEGSTAHDAFKSMDTINFDAIAGALLQWSLTYEVQFHDVWATLKSVFPNGIPDRVRKNIAVTLCGLVAFDSFCQVYGYSLPVFDINEVFAPVLNAVINEFTGRTKLLVDEMVEDLINYVKTSPYSPRFLSHYDKDANIFYFQIASAHNWWMASRRMQQKPTLESAAIKNQLRERMAYSDDLIAGSYVVSIGTKRIDGSPMHVYGISLPMAKASGLDIPENLDGFKVIIKEKEQLTNGRPENNS